MSSKVSLGMFWSVNGRWFEVTKMCDSSRCQITETWVTINKAGVKENRRTLDCIIVNDLFDGEYAYPEGRGDAWWMKLYAAAADFVPTPEEYAEILLFREKRRRKVG